MLDFWRVSSLSINDQHHLTDLQKLQPKEVSPKLPGDNFKQPIATKIVGFNKSPYLEVSFCRKFSYSQKVRQKHRRSLKCICRKKKETLEKSIRSSINVYNNHVYIYIMMSCMFTSFTTYSTNPYKSQTNWILLRKYNTFLSTKTNRINRREKKKSIQLLPDQVELSWDTILRRKLATDLCW